MSKDVPGRHHFFPRHLFRLWILRRRGHKTPKRGIHLKFFVWDTAHVWMVLLKLVTASFVNSFTFFLEELT